MALLVRAGYAIFFIELEYLQFADDQNMYIELAQLVSEHGISVLGSDRVPGYPIFLSFIYSVFGLNHWMVVVVQAIIDSFSCVFIGLLVQEVLSKGLVLGGLLSAFNLNMIVLSGMILTESLFLLVCVLFLLFFMKFLRQNSDQWLLLSVLLLAISSMIRPISYYLIFCLVIGLVLYWLISKETMLRIGIRLVGVFFVSTLALGATHYRNYVEYGAFGLVTQGGTHLFGWVLPAAYQYSGQGSYQDGQKWSQDMLQKTMRNDGLDKLPSGIFEMDLYYKKVTKIALLELGIVNVIKSWTVGSIINLLSPSVAYAPAVRTMPHPSFYETQGNGAVAKIWNYLHNTDGIVYLAILVIGSIFSFLFAILALFGSITLSKDIYKGMFGYLPMSSLFTLIMLIGYLLAITGPLIGLKYRLPIEPIMTIFVAYALQKKLLLKKSIFNRKIK